MHDLTTAVASLPRRFEAWEKVTVEDAADLKLTYGILENGLPDDQGVVRAGDIGDGRITTDQPGRTGRAHPRTTRAALREGDLVVVLVRRVGDAALVTAEHHGWIATRSVGIIRSKDPDVTEWLRIWLRTPTARSWIEQHVTAHVEPTLSLDALRKMPVALPPREQMGAIRELISLIERKTELNQQIAADAVALADAHYAILASERPGWPPSTFQRVARARTGKSASAPLPDSEGVMAPRVAPAQLFNASLPYIEDTTPHEPADPRVVSPPGTLLIAPRPDGAHTAVTLLPAVPSRGVLAVTPAEPTDLWWLLHELRSRSRDLSDAAHGRHARELTKRGFSALDVAWPGPETRHRFHATAEPLHRRARAALDENHTLKALLDILLRNIPSTSGGLFERQGTVPRIDSST